jgi:6-phosphogluconolactonase
MVRQRVVVVPDATTLGRRAAEHVRSSLERSVAERGVAHLALTGGTTAGLLYTVLASDYRETVPWRYVHLWWGDDRFVAFDDLDSNVRLVRTTLLAPAADADTQAVEVTASAAATDDPSVRWGIQVPAGQVHPFPIDEARATGRGPSWCAEQYDAALRTGLPADEQGVPVFDLVLLGVGADGHMLSCFPRSPLVDAPMRGLPRCAAVPPPTTALPAVPRVTCSPRLVGAARDVLVLVSGAGKAAVMKRILQDEAAPQDFPAAIAARQGATWLLDSAAAAELAHGAWLGT